MIQTGHGGEVVGRDVGGAGLRDQAVGVGRVAHDEYAHIFGSVVVDCFTLGPENLAVCCEEIGAFLPFTAGLGTNQENRLSILECFLGLIGDRDTGDQRECSVKELHRDPLSSGNSLRNIEQPEVNRGVLTKDVA